MKQLLLAVTILLAASQVWAAGGKGYVGTTAPATCAVGNFWIDTDGAANDRFYTCTATNTWTKNSGAGYTLPTAAADTLGRIKVGDRLSIADGVLSADVQTTDISGKEDSLGNPSTNGYVLASTTLGVRSWVEMTGGGTGIAHATSDGNYYASKDGGWASLAGVFLNPSGSAALLTNFPTLNQNTTGTAGGLSGTPNITAGTISAGAAGFNVDADGDVIAKSVAVTRTTSPSAIDLYEGAREPGDNKLTLTLSGGLAADATLNADQILVDGDIGSTVQAYDADLTTAAGAGAAGGRLSGSLSGGGVMR